MNIQAFPVSGVLLITPKEFHDERGFVSEVYSARQFESTIGPYRFVQDNHAFSSKPWTLRGLHFQIPPAEQGKLIRVLQGSIFDAVVDIRVGSPTYGQHVGIELSSKSSQQLWVPPGFAHGFLTLEPSTRVEYKLTQHYSPAHERGIAWDDSSLALPWPIEKGNDPVLSPKDKQLPPLRNLPPYFP